jgi:hypothetical protein
VKGITSGSFVPESLILPQGIPMLCDDLGLRTTILATLPTLDESGVVVRQSGGRDPHHRIWISDALTRGPQPASGAPSAGPTVAPSSMDRGKGPASSSSAPGGTGGSEEERQRRLRRANGSLVSDPPRSVRGLLAGPRRLAPRPRAHRGASVLRHHHHRARRHHHHLGVISPRGTTSSNSNSNSKSGGRPASRVAGKSRAPSECSPFFISLFIMSTGLNPSFACQGFFPLCSQGRASSARYHARQRIWLSAASICWEWCRRSAPGCRRRDSASELPWSSWGSNSSDANVKRHRSGGGGPNCAHPRHQG